jgi:glucose-6-phosphate 1-dehydrogenase
MIIFGASGDLTARKLVPALYHLKKADMLPDTIHIIGMGRTEYTDEDFREHLRQGLEKNDDLDPSTWQEFSQRMFYIPGSYDESETYQKLDAKIREFSPEPGQLGNRLFYMAVPPTVYPDIIHRLGNAGLCDTRESWSRLVIEKPFGSDLASARHLNDLIHEFFDEAQVYRIDHYLGKETVQNIMAFRFANFIFQEVWDRKYIDHVQITVAEDEGVGHRGGYYDQAGAIRDMLQNHLLQLLSLIAMESPNDMNARALRDEKVKLLQCILPIKLENTVWGQYEGYQQEDKVEENSSTPTYIALQLSVNNWRWQGVPIYLRTGKALARKTTEITVDFKYLPNPIFDPCTSTESNRITFCIQPNEGIRLNFELKTPGGGMCTSPVSMNFQYSDLIGDQPLPDAYQRLLLDIVQGDASLFARADEIERAWQIVTPLLQAAESNDPPPLYIYPKDSAGPAEANHIIEDDGRSWLKNCGANAEA